MRKMGGDIWEKWVGGRNKQSPRRDPRAHVGERVCAAAPLLLAREHTGRVDQRHVLEQKDKSGEMYGKNGKCDIWGRMGVFVREQNKQI